MKLLGDNVEFIKKQPYFIIVSLSEVSKTSFKQVWADGLNVVANISKMPLIIEPAAGYVLFRPTKIESEFYLQWKIVDWKSHLVKVKTLGQWIDRKIGIKNCPGYS